MPIPADVPVYHQKDYDHQATFLYTMRGHKTLVDHPCKGYSETEVARVPLGEKG